MGNNIGSAVNQKGITREQFQASLQRNGVKGDKFDNAMTIFDKYSAMNTEATGEDASSILDEQEQVMARNDFAQLNQDDDNNVGKKEYNKHGGKEAFGVNYSSAKAYMEAMEHAASNSGNDNPVGEMTVTDDGAVVVYGAGTEDTADDDVNIYTKGQDGKYTVSKPEAETVKPEDTVEEETTPDAPKPPTFNDKKAVGDAVVRYLLGMNADEAVDAGVDFGENFEYSVGEDKTATVKFNGKEYTARTNSEGKIVFENDEGEGTTLQQAVLNSDSTDVKHSYYNRGRKGNLKSTYNAETGVITNNSGVGRQAVSQTQTLSSMLMNNNEDTTMRLDGQLQADGKTRKALDGETIIASIDTSDDGSKGKITKSELIKYLNAAVKEANVTTEAAKPGKPGGSRIYAPDVDLDLKDLANIGIVFDKYAGDDKMLDASELDKLIADLKKNSMSSIAGKTGTYRYEGDGNPTVKPPKEDKPFKYDYGDVAPADRTRKNTSGGSVTYQYSGGAGGTRTMVADDGSGTTRIVKNANIAEYEDHGPLGMGKKEFVVIQGLEQNVRAEVVDGKAKGPMTIKVKDSNGNTTYRQVTYDTKTQKYSLGKQVYKNKAGQYKTATQRTSDGIKALGLDKNTKLPKGFSVDYNNKGELVYKFNGAELKPEVAKVMIMRVNTPPTKSNIGPAQDNPPTVKPSEDGRMTQGQVEQYMEKDTNFQNLKQTVTSWDNQMKAIEEKYGFNRGNLAGELRINNEADREKYTELELNMQVYGNDFEKNFKNTLQNWVDTPADANGSTITQNQRTLRDVKKETLPDGTKVYHAKEGYYNLYFNGMPGDKMSAEELKKHGLENNK